jgi:uncharacterized protein YneF (UPF0154 family)
MSQFDQNQSNSGQIPVQEICPDNLINRWIREAGLNPSKKRIEVIVNLQKSLYEGLVNNELLDAENRFLNSGQSHVPNFFSHEMGIDENLIRMWTCAAGQYSSKKRIEVIVDLQKSIYLCTRKFLRLVHENSSLRSKSCN